MGTPSTLINNLMVLEGIRLMFKVSNIILIPRSTPQWKYWPFPIVFKAVFRMVFNNVRQVLGKLVILEP